MDITIQGKKVKVDDAFATLSREEMDAVVDDIAADMQKRGMFDPTLNDFAVQGLSGVNEGIVNFGDFAGMVLSGGNLRGLGQSVKPLLESVGAIAPKSENDALEFTRRVGEDVGAALIPGGALAAKATRPLATAGAELAAAVGSGTGAAVAEKAAPGNVVAETVGQVVGSLTPSSVVRTVRSAVKGVDNLAGPSIDELADAKNAAYATVDNMGATYKPESYRRLMDDVADRVLKGNVNQYLHKDVLAFVDDINKRYPSGLNLTELDQLRQEVVEDLIKTSDGKTRRFGMIIKQAIDDFIEGATPADISGASGPAAHDAITTARAANRRLRATELVDEAIDAARLNTASSGSGGNINNALRQELKRLYKDKKKNIAFTDEQLAELRDVVEQGNAENLLRWIGKLSPQGNGLMAGLSLAGAIHNPLLLAAPVVGTIAKNAADSGTISKASALRANIASGGALGGASLAKERAGAGAALSTSRVGASLSGAANDNEEMRRRRLEAML